MLDIGRITRPRWAIAVLVFLCVSAVLFIAPWILSVFYDSGPYGNWNEEAMFKTREKQGNLTLLCRAGPCVACTSSEKEIPSFKCSPTGYHTAQQCTQDAIGDMASNSSAKWSHENIGEEKKRSSQNQESEETAQGDGSKRRRLLTAEDGLQVVYKTCIPQEVKEKLSVFGFEGFVLLFLLLSATAVHYRKLRGSSQGLQRIPSSARF